MNKVVLMGRLTRDPEVRYSQGESATAVARYTLAVNRRYKRDGEQEADFISCVTFGKSAEFAQNKESNPSSEREKETGTNPDEFMNVRDDDEIPFQ